jgi:hypothetical protein
MYVLSWYGIEIELFHTVGTSSQKFICSFIAIVIGRGLQLHIHRAIQQCEGQVSLKFLAQHHIIQKYPIWEAQQYIVYVFNLV